MGTLGNVQRAHKSGDAAPGIPGATFLDLETPSINNAGGYAFAGFVSTDDTGVWASRLGGPLELLYRGDEMPFHALGSNAIENFGSILINATGHVAFRSDTLNVPGADPPGVDLTTNSSMWSEGGGNGLREVAREGDQPVGAPAGTEYAGFTDPVINATGQIAFIAQLRGTGVTQADNQAIFAEDANGTLHLIARKGQHFDVDDGPDIDERTIASLSFWSGTGNEDGRRSGFNDLGQLAFTALFADGAAGVFVSNLVAAIGTPGDFNSDGIVDAADYVLWRKNIGAPAGTLDNDPTGEPIGMAQYVTWRAHFAAADTPALGSIERVPEPSILVPLAVVAYIWMLARYRCAARRERLARSVGCAGAAR